MSQFLNDLIDVAGSAITIEPFLSVDKNNQASYAAAVPYTANIGGPVKYMHRASAQQLVSSQTIYVFSEDQFSALDRITLPAGYDGTTTPKIMQVDRQTDELGFCYTTIYLG